MIREGKRNCSRCGEWKELDAYYAVPVGDGISRQCKECKKQYEITRRKQHPEIYRAYELKAHFGMTIEEYNEKLATQNGVCAICKQPETRVREGRVLPLCVDHSHASEQNRGLLCFRCNTGLGYFQDSPELLIAAAQYLKSFF